MTVGPAADAADTAVERLRTARERALGSRAAARQAVEQLRERNREESRQLAERSRTGRRGHQHPWPDHGQPRELRLYDTEDVQPPASPPRPPSGPPRQRATDDDWSQESWLH